MNAIERLDAFGKRVITEELGGADYAANAGAIASVLDRIAELEAALMWYSSPVHHRSGVVAKDGGEMARKVLKIEDHI